jgi:preprotein translocase subunit SecE
MDRLSAYFRESYDELLHKVSWPTWDTLQKNTTIVIIATIIITTLIFIMDSATNAVLSFLY